MQNNRIIEKEKVAIYASVLYDGVCASTDIEDAVDARNQFFEIREMAIGNLDLTKILSDPSYPADMRELAAKNIFANFNPCLVEMMSVLAFRNDVDKINQIFESFESLLKSKLNLCVADVSSTVPLDEELRDIITKKIESELKYVVRLNEKINPSLLGGIVISVDGRRLDASAFSQLEKAREVLKTTINGGER